MNAHEELNEMYKQAGTGEILQAVLSEEGLDIRLNEIKNSLKSDYLSVKDATKLEDKLNSMAPEKRDKYIAKAESIGVDLLDKRNQIRHGENLLMGLHEVGHAVDHANNPNIMRNRRIGSNLGIAGAVINRNNPKAMAASILAGSLPALRQELVASRYAYDKAKEIQGKDFSAAKALATLSPGFLSYLAPAAVPLLMKKASEELDEMYKEAKSDEFKNLESNKVALTDEEKKIVMDSKATWGDGRLAVWKSASNGKTTYVTHTHRAYNTAPTLKGAISRFHNFIEKTATDENAIGKDGKIPAIENALQDPIAREVATMMATSHEYKTPNVDGALAMVKNYKWEKDTMKTANMQGINKPVKKEKVLGISMGIKEAKGKVSPFIVVNQLHGIRPQTPGKRMLLDGHHRKEACEFLGIEEVPVYKGTYTGKAQISKPELRERD